VKVARDRLSEIPDEGYAELVGREVFYRSKQGMVAAAVTTSPSFRVTRRTMLFDDKPYPTHGYGAAYDVHPDGRRFLMIQRGEESPQVVVVLNAFDWQRAGGLRSRREGQ
jgi:hypothetical protein